MDLLKGSWVFNTLNEDSCGHRPISVGTCNLSSNHGVHIVIYSGCWEGLMRYEEEGHSTPSSGYHVFVRSIEQRHDTLQGVYIYYLCRA